MPEEMVEFKRACPLCGTVNTVMIPQKGIDAYRSGEHIQDAFPHLSEDEREILLSGICSKCWDEMFKEEE